ncbi:IpaD/SipD/SspD family type III secretion system needle tip protein [Serratia quinivorans]|uniref:IpaD/SipD/SspD family type III secretion system needle tip protein n=1 Tax=Serratia quinivorans TaxID=137545 RepID=UPI003982A9F2
MNIDFLRTQPATAPAQVKDSLNLSAESVLTPPPLSAASSTDRWQQQVMHNALSSLAALEADNRQNPARRALLENKTSQQLTAVKAMLQDDPVRFGLEKEVEVSAIENAEVTPEEQKLIDKVLERLKIKLEAMELISANPDEYFKKNADGSYTATDKYEELWKSADLERATGGFLGRKELSELSKEERVEITKKLNDIFRDKYGGDVFTLIDEWYGQEVNIKDGAFKELSHVLFGLMYHGDKMPGDFLERALDKMDHGIKQIMALIDCFPKEPEGPKSSWEIYDDLGKAINQMDKEYLSKYQDAVKNYTEFFDKINDAFAQFGENLSDFSVGNNIEKLFKNEYRDLFKSILDQGGVLLSGLSSYEAKEWAKALGPGAVARGGEVVINVEAVYKMYNVIKKHAETLNGSTNRGGSMNPQELQAVKDGLTAYMDRIQTSMQTMIQKYSTANSTFDNLIKVLSSTISSLLEADKNFLNI